MDDNAASHERRDSEVHPDPPTEVNDNAIEEKSGSPKPTIENHDANQDDSKNGAGPASPRPAEPPAPSSQATAPASTEELSNSVMESLFLNADDEEGLDPDTLANLAALSRLHRDEGEDDEEGEGGAGGDNDFSTLMQDSQHTMTREQMQEIVARLAQHQDDDDDGDQDAEGEDDVEEDGQGEERQGTPGGTEAKHQREDSEALQEVDAEEKNKSGTGDEQKPEGRGRKRKRNRTVLYVTSTPCEVPDTDCPIGAVPNVIEE